MKLALLLLLAGCAAPSALDAAVNAANGAHALAEQAGKVRDQICTESYRVARAADVPALDTYCEPLRVALARYETAWRALTAAIVAVRLHPTVADAGTLLADRERELDAAAAALAWAIEGTR